MGLGRLVSFGQVRLVRWIGFGIGIGFSQGGKGVEWSKVEQNVVGLEEAMLGRAEAYQEGLGQTKAGRVGLDCEVSRRVEQDRIESGWFESIGFGSIPILFNSPQCCTFPLNSPQCCTFPLNHAQFGIPFKFGPNNALSQHVRRIEGNSGKFKNFAKFDIVDN